MRTRARAESDLRASPPCSNFCAHSPDKEAPQRPREDEDNAEDPALCDEEGDGQHDGVGVILHHDEKLGYCDGCHEPRLLAQLLMELPERSGTRRQIFLLTGFDVSVSTNLVMR